MGKRQHTQASHAKQIVNLLLNDKTLREDQTPTYLGIMIKGTRYHEWAEFSNGIQETSRKYKKLITEHASKNKRDAKEAGSKWKAS
jgi:hypothetical protein